MGLAHYRKRRKFAKTPEPKGTKRKAGKAPIYVVQKHHARSLHFDLRLEMGGVLKSWAVATCKKMALANTTNSAQWSAENGPLSSILAPHAS